MPGPFEIILLIGVALLMATIALVVVVLVRRSK